MTGLLPGTLQRLPLVGRAGELTAVADALERARAGRGSALLVTGEPGVGKSRLMAQAAEEARRGGWQVVSGRAYPVETGIPYAIFSDAFVPFLQKLDQGTLSVLARGGKEWLATLFSALRPPGAAVPADPEGAESRVQLFWNFARFLGALAVRQPLLVVLDDLHAADASSIELVHFLARQLGDEPVALVATLVEGERAQPGIKQLQQSLGSLELLTVVRVNPLSPEHTDDLVRQVFGADPSVTREFTALLYGWTRGNAFFIEETLKGLVQSGRLRREGSGWLGWELSELRLPPSVRDAVLLRISVLTPAAREVAEMAAVMGGRASWAQLRATVAHPDDQIVAAVEQLRAENVLSEAEQAGQITYDFRHPMLRETLLGEIGLARRMKLHGRIAEALERLYGAAALDHAEELATHFMRAGDAPEAYRAARYLAVAGRRALSRQADREAADFLGAALERLPEPVQPDDPALDRFTLLVDLARAKQRLGAFDDARGLLERARAVADAEGDDVRRAITLRREGLSYLFSGRVTRALETFEEAAAAAGRAGEDDLLCRTHLSASAALLAVGRSDEARAALDQALAAAERTDDAALRARVHRGLLIFHTVKGPPAEARLHGERAIELARSCRDLAVAATCHWAMAVAEGLNARAEECAGHLERVREIADTIGSPLMHLTIEEVAIQYAQSLGDWDSGVARGERAIALARSLNQRGILPRLLSWTALFYLGRDETARAKEYIDEAWELVAGPGTPDVHSTMTVHVALVQYHLAMQQNEKAIEVGKRALALVDRTGYGVWAVHRLLPAIGEAYLHMRDLEGARWVAQRLRIDATALQHRLGLVYADACEAVITWLEGDVAAAAVTMRRAAEALDAVPFVPDAARVRRQLAGRLADLGDREGALRELRTVHEVLVKLGAHRELEKARIMFHELGARPPVRASGAGSEGLTGRELEIIRLVYGRLSNKAIGKELGISARTVGTHLSNIFKKLAMTSRAELADYARTFSA